jgi:hypothetical protein
VYLLGYRERLLLARPDDLRRLQRGGGWIHPAVAVDGRLAGGWRQVRKGARLSVSVTPFPGARVARRELSAEVADIGRFLDVKASLGPTSPG